MIIAVDGPAASGKGTLARALAAHFGLNYLDTGSLYRMVALEVLRAGGDPADAASAIRAAKKLNPSNYGDEELRGGEVGAAASVVAANPGVREAVLGMQREFAHRPPGAVLDGRDIGTVVCPEADLKLFVTASRDIRARRRLKELLARGETVNLQQVEDDLAARDRRDEQRTVSPLIKSGDAHLLDTTDLSIETAFERACALVAATRQV